MASEKDLLKEIALLQGLLNEKKRSQLASLAHPNGNAEGAGGWGVGAGARAPTRPASLPSRPNAAFTQPPRPSRPRLTGPPSNPRPQAISNPSPRGSRNLTLSNATAKPNPTSPHRTFANSHSAGPNDIRSSAPRSTLTVPNGPSRPSFSPASPHRTLVNNAQAPRPLGVSHNPALKSPRSTHLTLRYAAPNAAPPFPRAPFSAGRGRQIRPHKRGGIAPRPGRRKMLGKMTASQHESGATKQQSKGKKIKVVSIGGTLFDVSDDGQYLSRRNKSSAPPACSSRVNLRGVSYRRTDPNTYKRIDPPKKEYCMFYNRFGVCKNGSACPYLHDKSKVAVCLKHLKGACDNPGCTLSHTADPAKMPMCMYFVRGRCEKGSECLFAHVQVAPDAPLCQDFLKGYCPRRLECTEKHTWECPTFSETGSCPLGDNCRLQHKARRAHAATDSSAVAPAAFRPRPQASSENSARAKPESSGPGKLGTLSIKPDFRGDRMVFRRDDMQEEGVGERDTPVNLSIRPSFARDPSPGPGPS